MPNMKAPSPFAERFHRLTNVTILLIGIVVILSLSLSTTTTEAHRPRYAQRAGRAMIGNPIIYLNAESKNYTWNRLLGEAVLIHIVAPKLFHELCRLVFHGMSQLLISQKYNDRGKDVMFFIRLAVMVPVYYVLQFRHQSWAEAFILKVFGEGRVLQLYHTPGISRFSHMITKFFTNVLLSIFAMENFSKRPKTPGKSGGFTDHIHFWKTEVPWQFVLCSGITMDLPYVIWFKSDLFMSSLDAEFKYISDSDDIGQSGSDDTPSNNAISLKEFVQSTNGAIVVSCLAVLLVLLVLGAIFSAKRNTSSSPSSARTIDNRMRCPQRIDEKDLAQDNNY